jgi:hypothetical protein
MSKIDVHAVPALIYPTYSKTFVDPLQPDIEIVLNLRALSQSETALILMAAKEMVADFNAEDGQEPKRPPIVCGGVRIHVTFVHAYAVCTVLHSQTGDLADQYNDEELLIMAVKFPHAWQEIMEWVGSLEPISPKAPSGQPDGH